MIFFAEGAGIGQGDKPRGSLSRTGRDMIELEPMTSLPALAMVTKHVGLATTASTTYNEPYNLARKFATLDLIRKGRAGWNVVASWSSTKHRTSGLRQPSTTTRVTRVLQSSSKWSRDYGMAGRGSAPARQGGRSVFRRSKDAYPQHRGRFFNVRAR